MRRFKRRLLAETMAELLTHRRSVIMRCQQDLEYLNEIVNCYLHMLPPMMKQATSERAQISITRIAVELQREVADALIASSAPSDPDLEADPNV